MVTKPKHCDFTFPHLIIYLRLGLMFNWVSAKSNEGRTNPDVST